MDDKKRLVLRACGCPKNWLTHTDIPLSKKLTIDKVLTYLNDGGDRLFLTISGNPASLIQNIKIEKMKTIKFINYLDVFDNSFASQDEKVPFRLKKVNILYNVGAESAMKKGWSTALINTLVEKAKVQKVNFIVVSPLTQTQLLDNYGLNFSNKITIPEEPELKII